MSYAILTLGYVCPDILIKVASGEKTPGINKQMSALQTLFHRYTHTAEGNWEQVKTLAHKGKRPFFQKALKHLCDEVYEKFVDDPTTHVDPAQEKELKQKLSEYAHALLAKELLKDEGAQVKVQSFNRLYQYYRSRKTASTLPYALAFKKMADRFQFLEVEDKPVAKGDKEMLTYLRGIRKNIVDDALKEFLDRVTVELKHGDALYKYPNSKSLLDNGKVPGDHPIYKNLNMLSKWISKGFPNDYDLDITRIFKASSSDPLNEISKDCAQLLEDLRQIVEELYDKLSSYKLSDEVHTLTNKFITGLNHFSAELKALKNNVDKLYRDLHDVGFRQQPRLTRNI